MQYVPCFVISLVTYTAPKWLSLYLHDNIIIKVPSHKSKFHSCKTFMLGHYFHLTDEKLILNDTESDLPQIPNTQYSKSHI